MNHRVVRLATVAGMAAVVGLTLGACQGSSSAQPVYVTPSATPEITESPTEAPTETPAPTATPTPIPTATPTPLPTGSPSESSAPGSVCQGTAEHQNFFTSAAQALKFDVYCAGTLPARWVLNTAGYSKGTLAVSYKKSGAIVEIREGPFCTSSAAECSPRDSVLKSSVAFGDLTGTLVLYTPPSEGAYYYIYVAPGTSHAYEMRGPATMSQATFEAIAAGMVVVPEP